MNMFDTFLTTRPRFVIGQMVRVVGNYESDWPMDCVVTGIDFSAVKGKWNISIMPQDEINDRLGATDGFTENDLRAAH